MAVLSSQKTGGWGVYAGACSRSDSFQTVWNVLFSLEYTGVCSGPADQEGTFVDVSVGG